MCPLIEVPEDVDKALTKLEGEGRITNKPGFIWEAVRKAIKEIRKK